MSNSSALPSIPSNILSLTSPLIIGTLFNWGLFGVLSTQVYVYYLGFPDDRIRNKVLVYGVYLLEVVQTAMTADDLCFWFARGFGDMDNLDRVNLSPWDAPMLCSIIAWIVQCFYSFRIYMLRKSFISVSILILMISFSQLVEGIICGYHSFKLERYSRFRHDAFITRVGETWFITRIICDALIAATLLWLLLKSRKENTSNGKGAQILARLVHLIVQTNALTAVMALVAVISYLVLPESALFKCSTLISGKLYSNALLATLNNRIIARKLEMDDIVFRDSHSLCPPSNVSSSEVENSRA